MKKVKAEDDEVDGVWVKGKLREYFIDMEARVFDYKGGKATQYRCIVDKSVGRELNKIDRVITRIYWLLNDKYVVDKVETLK